MSVDMLADEINLRYAHKRPRGYQRHPTEPWKWIPKPSAKQRKEWAKLDDSVPPVGEADGEFRTFVEWVNKAASWIGGTGAKCYDAKDRRCPSGAEFMRARDENTFPIRWYLPDRFKLKTKS